MDLFTFIVEYQGGTYIIQFRARSYIHAAKNLARKLMIPDVAINEKDIEYYLYDREQSPPVAIEGVINTWFTTFMINEQIAHINYIRTSE